MSKNYQVSTSGIAFEQFSDEFVIVNLPEGHYYSLRNSAFFMFQFLVQGANSKSIAKELSQHFDISEEKALLKSEDFIQELKKYKLLIPTEKSQILDIPIPKSKDTFLDPKIEMFDDMKELLILDPVHDVNPQEGWPLKK